MRLMLEVVHDIFRNCNDGIQGCAHVMRNRGCQHVGQLRIHFELLKLNHLWHISHGYHSHWLPLVVDVPAAEGDNLVRLTPALFVDPIWYWKIFLVSCWGSSSCSTINRAVAPRPQCSIIPLSKVKDGVGGGCHDSIWADGGCGGVEIYEEGLPCRRHKVVVWLFQAGLDLRAARWFKALCAFIKRLIWFK